VTRRRGKRAIEKKIQRGGCARLEERTTEKEERAHSRAKEREMPAPGSRQGELGGSSNAARWGSSRHELRKKRT